MAMVALSPAMADTTTSAMTVTAEVAAECNFTMNDSFFANYNPTQESSLVVGVDVICSKGISYSFSADKGVYGVDTQNRVMQSLTGADLKYTLDVAGVNLGDVPGQTKDGIGTGAQTPFSINIKIPSGQFVVADTYSDTVMVSLTY